MKQVTISYNPYSVTTEIKVDGQVPQAGTDFVQMTKGTRLLDYIDRFLTTIFSKYRNNDVAFEFHGTKQDADDLRDAINRFNKTGIGHDFYLDKVFTSEIGENPLEELKKLCEEGKKGPFAEIFNSEKMQSAFKRAISPEFEVNVIATMSSGKSTLINSLLGKDIMPSKQEACTATIASIEDCDDMPTFMAVRYNADGKLLSAKPEEVSRKLLTLWNDDDATSRIEIKGNIPTVDETKDSKYVFIDTPGPNNSRNEEHQKTTYHAIESKPLSMIIYVLNATNFGVNDDANLLLKVSKVMSQGGRQAQDRFVFVLNKIDRFKKDEDSVPGILERAKEYLQKYGIENPLIIPTSAELAKLLRLKKYSPAALDEETEDELDKMSRKFLRREDLNLYQYTKGRLNPEVVRRLENRLNSAQTDDERLLIFSGVPVLEELLKDFLFRYALPAKIKDAIDTFDRVLRDYKQSLKLNEVLQQSDEEIQKIAETIKTFASSKENLDKTEQFKREIRAVNFQISQSTNAKLADILEEQNRTIKRLEARLKKKDVGTYDAQHHCETAVRDCQSFEAEVESVLRRALREECFYQMDNLRSKYQAYITDVLKMAFPNDDIVHDLQMSVMEMPDTDELITYNTELKEYTVYKERHKWSLARLFGSTHYKVTKYRDVVDMNPIFDEVQTAVLDFSQNNIRNFKKKASDALDTAKESLISIMDSKINEMRNLEAQISAAGQNKKQKEAQKREIEAKITWYDAFQAKLQKILSI